MKGERYVRCECGNVVRYIGELTGEKCSSCERRLVDGKAITKKEWLEGHNIYLKEGGYAIL